MGCLLCGKEIGPLRILRDSEFCSSSHRNRYKEWLGKALHTIAEPDPPPAGIAGFLTELQPLAGNCSYSANLQDFNPQKHSLIFDLACPFSVPPVLGGTWKALGRPLAWDRSSKPALGEGMPPNRAAHLPGFDLQIAADATPQPAQSREEQPPLAHWAASPAPQPVQSMIWPASLLEWMSPAAAVRLELTLGLEGFAVEAGHTVAAEPEPPRRAFLVFPGALAANNHLRPECNPGWLPYRTALAPAAAPRSAGPMLVISGTTPLPQAVEARSCGASPVAIESSRLKPCGNSDWLLYKPAVASPTPVHFAGPMLMFAGSAPVSQSAGIMACAASAAPVIEPTVPVDLPHLAGIETEPERKSLPATGAVTAASKPATGTSRPGSNPDWLLQQAEVASPEPLQFTGPNPRIAGPAPSPRAIEVTSYVQPAAILEMMHAPLAAASRFDIDAIEEMPAVSAEEPSDVVAASGQWIPGPAAQPVASMVFTSSAGWVVPAIALRAPLLDGLAIAEPFIPAAAWPAMPPAAVPVAMDVFPSDAAQAIPALPTLLPGTLPMFALAPDGASYVEGPAPEPVESMPAAQLIAAPVCSIEPITAIRENGLPAPSCTYGCAPASHPPLAAESFVFPSFRASMMPGAKVALPPLSLVLAEKDLAPGLDRAFAVGTLPAPQSQVSAPQPPVLEPIRAVAMVPPEAPAAAPAYALPEPGFHEIEYFSHRPVTAISRNLRWQQPSVELIAPQFALRAIFEKPEDAARQKKASKKPAMAEIFRLPEAKRKAARPVVHYALKAIAASVVVGGVLWFTAGTMRIGNQTPAVNRDVSMVESGTERDAGQPAAAAYGTQAASSTLVSNQPHGPIARVRQAISNRASATVTDSFRNGMEAWGSKPKTWAAGWSRHPEGYVQPGQLALFRPSLQYTDYHLEFFGQIDNKSIGWTVRSKDPKNYYAMKFSVVEPGLRPIIAMVHYSVVGGRKSRTVSTPLNVMVHNSTPFQVAVEVKGSRMVTSIDGQEVDTWIDDTIPAGGVGFFAEAGEKSRLYWMKVSKNEDFLGRVCAYLSSKLGDGSNTSAELWPAEMPGRAPAPGQPRHMPGAPADATLAAAAAGFGGARRRQRNGICKGRIEIWSL